jgi:hypothetical protein
MPAIPFFSEVRLKCSSKQMRCQVQSAADRVRIQYAENEQRVDFSDMERALGDVPWGAVEERF